MGPPFVYRLFGLTVASDLDLPETPRGDPDVTPDVVITRGDVPIETTAERAVVVRRYGIPGPRWIVRDHEAGVSLRIEGGTSITVSCRQGDPVSEADVRLYALASGVGAILVQRGLLPFHANAVVGPRGAILICGDVGAGKSTTALGLVRSGHLLIADDLCAIDTSDTAATVIPGPPRLKLWRQTLDPDTAPDERLRIRSGVDKFYVAVAGQDRPVALHLIIVLEKSHDATTSGVSAHALSGADRILALTPHLYKATLPELVAHWPDCMARFERAIGTVGAYRVRRPAGGDSRPQVVREIERLAGG